jgi:hypothetical protein
MLWLSPKIQLHPTTGANCTFKYTPPDAIIVTSSYILQFNRSIHSKWPFLGCAPVAFSERFNHHTNSNLANKRTKPQVTSRVYHQMLTKSWLQCQYTVGPRFTNAHVHEQFGSRTNFPSKRRLGWRTVSRITNTQAGNSGKLRVSARESVAG